MKFEKKKIMKKIITLLFGIILAYSCSTNTDTNGNSVTTVVPASTSNLVGTVVSTTELNLSWTDNSTNETGFKIERKTGAGSYVVVASTTTDISTYSDTGLTPGATYTYRVYSYNAVGNSLTYSNELSLTTSALIVLPSLTTTDATVTIGGNASSGGNITDTGNSVITSRGVVWDVNANPTIALSTKTVDGSGDGLYTSTITGLVSGTTYFVRAYATNSIGTSYGNEIIFTESAVPLDGLVGYWPFIGNASDGSGNGNNATVNGASLTIDRFGIANSAYGLSTLSDNLSVTNAQPSFNNNGLTVSLWLKFPTQYNYSSLSLVKNGVSYTNGFNLAIDQNNSNYGTNNYSVLFLVGNGNGVSFISNQAELGVWSNIVSTFDGTNIKIYLNGILKGTQPFNQSMNVLNNNLVFGSWDNLTAPAIKTRQLDDIGIWNRALTQAEITALYNSTN